MENQRDRRYSRNAEFKAGLNNKFYDVEVEEQPDGSAKWLHRWGRIGTNGQTKEGKAHSFSSAVRLCDEQFEKKLAKGYREVTAMEVLASAAQSIEERPVRGLPPMTVLIPNFGAGPSEERCKAFAQKYVDKMNVIRKSKDDLGSAYWDQMESLVDSYRDEWNRMRTSKTHAGNLGTQAEDAFKEILIALREFGIMGKGA